MVSYAILKEITVLMVICHDVTGRIFDQWISRQTVIYCLPRNSLIENSTGEIMTIDHGTVSGIILIPLPIPHYMSIIFFALEFIIWFKSNQVKQVDLETSLLARSLYDLMLWSLPRSLSRTYERSTCSKSSLSGEESNNHSLFFSLSAPIPFPPCS